MHAVTLLEVDSHRSQIKILRSFRHAVLFETQQLCTIGNELLAQLFLLTDFSDVNYKLNEDLIKFGDDFNWVPLFFLRRSQRVKWCGFVPHLHCDNWSSGHTLRFPKRWPQMATMSPFGRYSRGKDADHVH